MKDGVTSLGTNQRLISIDQSTGVMSNDAILDYEKCHQVVVEVRATDSDPDIASRRVGLQVDGDRNVHSELSKFAKLVKSFNLVWFFRFAKFDTFANLISFIKFVFIRYILSKVTADADEVIKRHIQY